MVTVALYSLYPLTSSSGDPAFVHCVPFWQMSKHGLKHNCQNNTLQPDHLIATCPAWLRASIWFKQKTKAVYRAFCYTNQKSWNSLIIWLSQFKECTLQRKVSHILIIVFKVPLCVFSCTANTDSMVRWLEARPTPAANACTLVNNTAVWYCWAKN